MNFLKKAARVFSRDQRGTVAIIFGLTVVPTIALSGAAVDYGKAVQARTQLQRAVDSAALAAAQIPDATQDQKIATATDFFWANDAANPFGVLGVPVLTVHFVNNELTVTSRAEVNATFMALAGVATLQISATSTVAAITQSTPGQSERACVLVTEPSAARAMKLNGGARVEANCGLHVNSSSSDSLHAQHDTTVDAAFTCLYGDFHREDGQHFNPTPSHCNRMQDPFITMVAPANAKAKCTNPKNTTTRYQPGVYCGINITSNSNVTFDPGIYVINGGQFNIGSGSTVRLTPGLEETGIKGVFFYLAGSNSTFKFGSHSNVKLRAPSEGMYKGMLIWNASQNSADHEFGCHSESIVQGTIYSPRTGVQITSNGNVGASADWTVWVVKTLELSSSARLTVQANYSASATPLPLVLQTGGMMHEIAAGQSKVVGARIKN